MRQRVRSATAMTAMAGGALRLLHLGPHGMQVIAGRNYREQENQRAAESTNEDERRTPTGTSRTGRGSPLPPQQPGRQQQREPTKIKKKLHTKCHGRSEERPRP